MSKKLPRCDVHITDASCTCWANPLPNYIHDHITEIVTSLDNPKLQVFVQERLQGLPLDLLQYLGKGDAASTALEVHRLAHHLHNATR